MVDTLSELCSPFLKEGNSAFIAAIKSAIFHKTNICHSNHYGSTGPSRKKLDLITKTTFSNLIIFTALEHRVELEIERKIREN